MAIHGYLCGWLLEMRMPGFYSLKNGILACLFPGDPVHSTLQTVDCDLWLPFHWWFLYFPELYTKLHKSFIVNDLHLFSLTSWFPRRHFFSSFSPQSVASAQTCSNMLNAATKTEISGLICEKHKSETGRAT